MKKQAELIQRKIKAPTNLFNNSHVGIQSFQPLKHKNDKPYTDLEYMELLGRHCKELEEKGQPYFYDKNCVAVAKEIVRGRDELGYNDAELRKYLTQCLDLSELS